MNYLALAFGHTRETLRRHWGFFLLLTTAHLITNAAFTGFVSFAHNTLFFGSHTQPEAVALIASAPLIASLSVIITSVTFGTARRSKILNKDFVRNWIPVTGMYAWFFFVAWFCRVHLPARMEALVSRQLWLTESIPPEFFTIDLPWIVILVAATITTLSVPVFVARRQAFWRLHGLIATGVVLIMCGTFMAAREVYRRMNGDLDPYHWLPFPGNHPEALAYDRILYALLELPFLIPVAFLTTCVTASLLVAADLDQTRARHLSA
ncbi:MAG: hypothetical protein OER56_07445 [Hyphomicrobiales bacterium]|nr:hypothetical protein [Hyphomicrobiales bacterium]